MNHHIREKLSHALPRNYYVCVEAYTDAGLQTYTPVSTTGIKVTQFMTIHDHNVPMVIVWRQGRHWFCLGGQSRA